MSDKPTPNHEAFRKFELDGWNGSYAGYHDNWRDVTPQAIPRLLDGAAVGTALKVLDVASGPGYVSAAAAARGAETLGVDFSPNMVDLANTNFPNLRFQTGIAEELPFPGESFDVVLSNFGILHFADPDKALLEAHRVLKPGGRLGFSAWIGAEDSALMLAMQTIGEIGTLDVDLPPGEPVFRFGDAAECRRVLDATGFSDISSADIGIIWKIPRPEMLVDLLVRSTARTKGLLNAQDPAIMPAIVDALAERCKPFDKGDHVALPMPALVTVATKPG